MKYTTLPDADIKVSKICLGTMTWGEQNNQDEAFEQMTYAFQQGVNFWDTAEIYSVPINPNTQGSTETMIGNWLHKNGKRDKIVLATKAAGPGPQHLRQGPNFTKAHLTEALEGSLRRLQTDYVDVYQLHWPERHVPKFGQVFYEHKPEVKHEAFQSVLETLQGFIQQGKVRKIGISNETPWGMMKWITEAEKNNLPKIATIQNAYSLMNRVFESGHAEICYREKIGLLAYSPLAGGLLSGKYQNNAKPVGSRFTLFPDYFPRYSHQNVFKAVEKYSALAKENGLTPTQLALAFVNSKAFVTSNIIGATKMEQLKEDIDSINITLTEEVLNEIDLIHFQYQNPAP